MIKYLVECMNPECGWKDTYMMYPRISECPDCGCQDLMVNAITKERDA